MKAFEGYEEQKRFNVPSAIDYIEGHLSALNEFLEDHVKRDDWQFVIKEFMTRNPVLLANMIKINYETTEAERKESIYEEITKEGTFMLMLGAKRYGKTATSLSVAEDLIEKGIDIYWFGYNEKLKELYPNIKQTFNLAKIENGFVLYDEAIQTMFSREAMTVGIRRRIKNLPTAGHRGLCILWISQSPRVDALLRDLIEWVWFKPLFNLGADIFKTGIRIRPELRYMLPFKKWENLLYNTQTEEPYMFTNELPSKWCEALSKPYSLIKNREKAMEFYENLRKGNAFSQQEASSMLEIVGWTLDELFPEQFIERQSKSIDMEERSKRVGVGTSERKRASADRLIRCKFCKSTNYMIWSTKEGRYRCNDCMKTFRVSL